MRDPPSPPPPEPPQSNSGVILALVAIALILAISFFYLTNERRQDRQADAVTDAAASADNAVQAMGDAARNAADDLERTR
ncbi:hypothetical protein [Sphingobium naphthae]|uniref:Uncharacterized protein n=1 Tax=Sphingobium naphthae TaxID=1886786 RepID=A0ABU3ZT16_9SPHN|nr:hypothetical protein [Sphingobium naphthae]MDV5822659.1 hypothetical protein [Sphingobium naphthae]MEA3541589.1 hypothetical protein [Pseudomonadota bacterium]